MNPRFSEYRVMWLLVFFDLPTDTRKERRAYADFRKGLLKDGFSMFQFSLSMSAIVRVWENAEVHKKRVKSMLPETGQVGVMCVTDKQFEGIEIFYGTQASSKHTVNPVLLA